MADAGTTLASPKIQRRMLQRMAPVEEKMIALHLRDISDRLWFENTKVETEWASMMRNAPHHARLLG
jgi:hypothetical protein